VAFLSYFNYSSSRRVALHVTGVSLAVESFPIMLINLMNSLFYSRTRLLIKLPKNSTIYACLSWDVST
jgi:hypothetical protein